jgi:hypothetical protein
MLALLTFVVFSIIFWAVHATAHVLYWDTIYLGIRVFMLFAGISPIINLFMPHWKLNTALFVVSWVILYLSIVGTYYLGYTLTLQDLSLFWPMLASGLFLPVIIAVRFWWRRSMGQYAQPENNGH